MSALSGHFFQLYMIHGTECNWIFYRKTYIFCPVDVDDDDEEDDEDAEEGYDEMIVTHGKDYARDEGPSARDIDGLLRGKDMWRYFTTQLISSILWSV